MKIIPKAFRIARAEQITQFYLPPTRLSTNLMRHSAFTPSCRASPHFGRYSFPLTIYTEVDILKSTKEETGPGI